MKPGFSNLHLPGENASFDLKNIIHFFSVMDTVTTCISEVLSISEKEASHHT